MTEPGTTGGPQTVMTSMSLPQEPNGLFALFLSGAERERDGSRIYRCDYAAAQLRRRGFQCAVRFYREVEPELFERANAVVFSRCPFNSVTLDLVRLAQRGGVTILGDLDDRIFSPWNARDTGFVRSLEVTGGTSTAALESVAASHTGVLRLLPLLHRVIVSTDQLEEELRELGIPAVVMPNAIDETQCRPRRRSPRELQRLLFMSGTRTHDADFAIIASALWRFLRSNPDVGLTLLGVVEAPPELAALHNVTLHGKVSQDEMFDIIDEHDLCLVPLENTVFNDCKSALKFIECGLVSVPVIASPRREFARCIKHEANGFLAETPEEWFETLSRLRNEPHLLLRAAEGAYDSVVREHSVSARSHALGDFVEAMIQQRTEHAS